MGQIKNIKLHIVTDIKIKTNKSKWLDSVRMLCLAAPLSELQAKIMLSSLPTLVLLNVSTSTRATFPRRTNSTILWCWAHVVSTAMSLRSQKNIKTRLKMYEQEHSKLMSCSSIAQMLSTMLYYKRFFPYYTWNLLAGLDAEGKGAIYSYDPVGSYERETYRAEGSSASLLQSFLDNQIGQKNLKEKCLGQLTKEKCVELIKDVFISAAEREIETGDGVAIHIITKDGIENDFFPLRRD